MCIIKNGKLVITLKSDLCMGSGYSYAGIVDNDTSYDEYGLPYIPAKRLKGCIRETIETMLYRIYSAEEVEKVFGKKGSNCGAVLKIDNAYIKGSDKIRVFLSQNPQFGSQDILSRYTRINGQTRMNDGVAEKGSLRYIRVVDHYSPTADEELVFEADFSCDSDDWEMIEKGAEATRHIGLKRNRGLGNVRIKVEKRNEEYISNREYLRIKDSGNGKKLISFAVSNIQPLMISRSEEDESVDYIPGQQVLGMLASKYLHNQDNKPDDPEFRALFLDGQAIFSNLYPYDGENVYYPAPDYLNRLKKSKKIVYTAMSSLPRKEEIKNENDYWYERGNQPKKMKGKYVAWLSANEVSVCEVKKDVIYHHSHRNTHEIDVNGEKREEGILYSQEVIRKGQAFAGTITVPDSLVETVVQLLLSDDMYFGKSKAVQYGKCSLVNCSGDLSTTRNTAFENGKDIVVTFQSDAVLNDGNGNPTVFYNEVWDTVKNALGIPSDEQSDRYISSLQTCLATGYSGVWNLRKSTVPAIKAGSFLTYHLTGNYSCEKDYIGERTLEGYGKIRVDDASECQYEGINEIKDKNTKNCDDHVYASDDVIKELIIPIIYDRWLERKIYSSINGNESVKVTNAAAGRFALMLRESLDSKDNKDNKDNTNNADNNSLADAFEDFGDRIESIKRDETKEEGRKLLGRIGVSHENKETNKKIWRIDNKSSYFRKDSLLEDELNMIHLSESQDEMIKRWPTFMMAILTDRKYKGRE